MKVYSTSERQIERPAAPAGRYERTEALLEILNARGVDAIFMNPGLDVSVIQAGLAKGLAAGRRVPKAVLCLDESVALSAAHGYYMVTGRPQVVMVHTELGTLQLGGSLVNVQWGRVPVIILTGEPAAGERVTWRGEPYDQGSIVRNSVKWEHALKSGDNIHEVLEKAFSVACSDPCGPVYVTYPMMGYMTDEIDREEISAATSRRSVQLSPADLQKLEGAAGMLALAKRPVIVTGFAGRHPQSVTELVKLAETLGAPVISGPQRMNFPTTHSLCAGIESRPIPHIQEADVVLAIDYDTGYVAAAEVPRPEAAVVHIGVDPKTQGRPIWGRAPDLFLKTDSSLAIPILTQAIDRRLTPETRASVRQRTQELESLHREQRDRQRAIAMASAGQQPISPDWLSRCVDEVIDDDTIVVNNIISHSKSVAEQIRRTKPGTLLSCPGGSINWALGAALGAKLAAPDRTVVSLVTDGGFIWGCPVATLWGVNAYHAPFLAVIYNNQAYGSIKRLVNTMSGGKLSDEMAFDVGVQITPSPDYAAIAQACGAYGRTVADPAKLIPALQEGLAEVRSDKPAVVDVRLANG
ncbi:MAG: thiamine pyrophosphate-requiring protein [Chloroflexota bacterium]|nr:thiamine pyrophosphate-requiring protein [Chloroflexota bacterium]